MYIFKKKNAILTTKWRVLGEKKKKWKNNKGIAIQYRILKKRLKHTKTLGN